jgi:hypothetical protein
MFLFHTLSIKIMAVSLLLLYDKLLARSLCCQFYSLIFFYIMFNNKIVLVVMAIGHTNVYRQKLWTQSDIKVCRWWAHKCY